MALDIPIRMSVVRVVFLITRNLDLFEAPLREDRVRSTKITTKRLVSEPQASRQRVNAVDVLFAALFHIINNFNPPVIAMVAYGSVSVARDFMVEFCDRSRDIMRVQVAGRGGMLEPNDITILEETKRAIDVESRFVPARLDGPLIVVILVVIASYLLLIRANRVRLNVRMEKSSSVSHVLESQLGPVCDL